MLWIYRIFSGFLKVRFYGEFREKILSLCATNGINLWNSKNVGDTIETYILVRDFRFLPRIARGKGIRVHILKKTGVPFVTERYKKRYGIAAGALIFFLILEIMSGYIWIIDIKGNHKVSDSEILAACNKIGIHEGIKKDSFFPKAKKEELLLKLDKIAWASLNIEGSRLTVNVSETREKAQVKQYSNLKAKADGVIEKMDIVSGYSTVKVGEAVKKGDLLVSGIIETADGTRFVNSKGTVIAKTQHKITLSEAFTQKVKVTTGKVKTKCVLDIYGFKAPLYLGSENDPYTESLRTETLSLFGQNLPIRLYKKRFEFYSEKTVNFSYDTLCKRLESKLTEEIKALKGENIRVKSRKIDKTDTKVTLKAVVELQESIAYEDKLLINTGN